MKLTHRMAKSILFLASFVVLVSCNKDEESVPLDFSIKSTQTFKIISTYENGWIQEAVYYDISGNILSEIEYHANGFIKSCDVYTPRVDNIPVLSLSVTRDENNLPLQSIYYYTDGSVLSKINYQNGLLKDKTVYSLVYTTVSTYTDGVIQKQESTSDEGVVSTLTYDYTNQERQLKIVNNDVIEHEEVLPLLAVSGEGVNTESDQILGNRFKDQQISERTLNTSFSTGIAWEGLNDFENIQPAPLIYDLTSTADLPQGYFSLAYDFYRMAMEQYPFIESALLQGKFFYADKAFSVVRSIPVNEEIDNEIANDANAFNLKYGNQYLSDVVFGKYGYVVGTIRNLPSDTQLRKQLMDLAYKKASFILGSEIPLSADEKTTLSNVFFELKFFSPTLGADGIVLKTPKNYEDISEMISNSDNWNIQEVYEAY